MAIFDIIDAGDYIGGRNLTPGKMMAVDALGRWTQSTVPTVPSTETLGVTAELSVGNNVLYANADSLGYFGATPVAQQASVSVEKANYTSVDAVNSVTIMNALNALAKGINSLGAITNVFGFTA